MSHGRAGSLSVAETLRAGTVPGVSSPVLRSSASGVAGIFGGARKVEVRAHGERTERNGEGRRRRVNIRVACYSDKGARSRIPKHGPAGTGEACRRRGG